jgi:hypothetical protein
MSVYNLQTIYYHAQTSRNLRDRHARYGERDETTRMTHQKRRATIRANNMCDIRERHVRKARTIS